MGGELRSGRDDFSFWAGVVVKGLLSDRFGGRLESSDVVRASTEV